MLSALTGKIYKGLAIAAGALAAAFYLFWRVASNQRYQAEEKAMKKSREAEARKRAQKQAKQAREASKEAKRQGDAAVEKVREKARSGDRSHFESGFVRDDD